MTSINIARKRAGTVDAKKAIRIVSTIISESQTIATFNIERFLVSFTL